MECVERKRERMYTQPRDDDEMRFAPHEEREVGESSSKKWILLFPKICTRPNRFASDEDGAGVAAGRGRMDAASSAVNCVVQG